ncbi:sce7725 family protein [Wenzhouxiangella sp. C33]|uniref:Sce7725 family protein n=1 Tax=Wenzhouxiangella limi TaxID=2707351 RepID=A0A845UTA4_9GAMM|nr:sce7725 family protein [Wenzhouxiangella limi]
MLQLIAPLIQRAPVVPVVELASGPGNRLGALIDYYSLLRIPMGLVVNRVAGRKSLCSQGMLDKFPEMSSRASALFPVFRLSMGLQDLTNFPETLSVIENEPGQSLSLVGRGDGTLGYRIDEHQAYEVGRPRAPGSAILLRDGFNRRDRNADYPFDESFDSGPGRLNLNGYSGWGDYTITGGECLEGGGAPATVAIHLTYWAPEDGLRVRHYLSDTVDGTQDT